MTRGALVALLVACSGPKAGPVGDDDDAAVEPLAPGLGATWEPDDSGVIFRVGSTRATRIELWIYDAPRGAERARIVMEREDAAIWRARVAASELPATIYYGYRVWGPNWAYD